VLSAMYPHITCQCRQHCMCFQVVHTQQWLNSLLLHTTAQTNVCCLCKALATHLHPTHMPEAARPHPPASVPASSSTFLAASRSRSPPRRRARSTGSMPKAGASGASAACMAGVLRPCRHLHASKQDTEGVRGVHALR
jgi:hypothetical protein